MMRIRQAADVGQRRGKGSVEVLPSKAKYFFKRMEKRKDSIGNFNF